MTRSRPVVILLAVLGAAALAVGTAWAQTVHDVQVVDNDYTPGELTITAGDTVRWTQTGDNPHTVTAMDGSFDSHPDCPGNGCMGSGDTFQVTFTETGTVDYFCKVHGVAIMSGTITVQAAAQDPASPTPSPTPTPTPSPSPSPTPTADPTPTAEAGTSATPTPTPSPDAAGALPETGADAWLIVGLAALMVLVGATALTADRRAR